MFPQLLLAGYGLLFLGYVLAAVFIIFHIMRYSFNKSLASIAIFAFTAITVLLLLANVSLFLAIPWNQLFSSIGISF